MRNCCSASGYLSALRYRVPSSSATWPSGEFGLQSFLQFLRPPRHSCLLPPARVPVAHARCCSADRRPAACAAQFPPQGTSSAGYRRSPARIGLACDLGSRFASGLKLARRSVKLVLLFQHRPRTQDAARRFLRIEPGCFSVGRQRLLRSSALLHSSQRLPCARQSLVRMRSRLQLGCSLQILLGFGVLRPAAPAEAEIQVRFKYVRLGRHRLAIGFGGLQAGDWLRCRHSPSRTRRDNRPASPLPLSAAGIPQQAKSLCCMAVSACSTSGELASSGTVSTTR